MRPRQALDVLKQLGGARTTSLGNEWQYLPRKRLSANDQALLAEVCLCLGQHASRSGLQPLRDHHRKIIAWRVPVSEKGQRL